MKQLPKLSKPPSNAASKQFRLIISFPAALSFQNKLTRYSDEQEKRYLTITKVDKSYALPIKRG